MDSPKNLFIQLVEGRVHVFDIEIVCAKGLRQGQIEEESQFQEPIQGHDVVDSFGEKVEHWEGRERGPVDQPLRVIILKEGANYNWLKWKKNSPPFCSVRIAITDR